MEDAQLLEFSAQMARSSDKMTLLKTIMSLSRPLIAAHNFCYAYLSALVAHQYSSALVAHQYSSILVACSTSI